MKEKKNRRQGGREMANAAVKGAKVKSVEGGKNGALHYVFIAFC